MDTRAGESIGDHVFRLVWEVADGSRTRECHLGNNVYLENETGLP